MFYPAQLNVYGGNSLPQISYQYDAETSSWKKHYNIYDHQGTLQQQYKYVNATWNPPFNTVAEPTLMQAHYPFGETRWEMDDLAEENKSTLNWIGKQKDKENGLGDHGVRKYEYETGRFTSIDPLWNKYYGWTPYQYSMNSPVGLVDFDGMKVYAIDDVSRENILNSVESDYRDLVKFKDNGEVFLKGNHNLAPLKKDLSNVTNITALEYLIKSDEIIEVSESSDYKYVNAKGEYKDGSLDWYNRKAELIAGGNGATLVKYDPNIKITSQRADVHQVIVSPNQFLSLDKNIKATKGSTAAHEMYGHLLLFLFQKNYLGHSGKVGEFIKGAESRSRE